MYVRTLRVAVAGIAGLEDRRHGCHDEAGRNSLGKADGRRVVIRVGVDVVEPAVEVWDWAMPLYS